MTQLQPHNEDQTSSLLARTISNLAEGITGIAAADRKNWSLSIGHLLQRVRGTRFLETLKQEWDEYRRKGRIKDDYVQTEQNQECLQEVLDALDNDSPDHVRFAALKHVFLNTATERLSSRDSVLPQQYMRICRSLSSGEVLVLQANYQLAKSGYNPEHYGATEWIRTIAESSELRLPSLVESHENALMEKCLIGQRRLSDRSGVVRTDHFRLTDLGYELSRFMEDYETEKDV